MTHSIPETDQLLQRARRGDVLAAEQLFVRYRGRLRSMIRLRMDRHVLTRLDASDVVQEVFLEASRKLKSYLEQPPLPFYPWLRQMAWQRLVKLHEHHLRAQKRSVQREVRWDGLPTDSMATLVQRVPAADATPSKIAADKESQHRLRSVLLELAEQDREILIMRFLEQLTVAEVAAVLDLPVGTVKTRQFRAISRLRTRLTQGGDRRE